MDQEAYKNLIGEQAAELERRIHAAGVKIELTPMREGGWVCVLTGASIPKTRMSLPGGTVRSRHPLLSTALWLAARMAGFTEGLDTPPA